MEKISNAEIKKYTTYKLEGTVSEIYVPSDVLELKNLLSELKNKNIRYKILGNGSNLIVSSKYDGVLIKLKNFDTLNIDGNTVKVGAGYMLPKLALKCAENGLSGLEFAYGIPATIGGAVYQNAGAYGFSIDKVIKDVTILDGNYEIITLSKAELKFGYRDSVFKHKNFICLEVTLELKKGNSEDILEKMKENLKHRKENQPLEYPSAGSVFRNPIGYSAGKLIEEAGCKGAQVGDVMVSYKHANFIVNIGKATAEDVLELIKLVQKKVKDKTGILLETEQEYLE